MEIGCEKGIYLNEMNDNIEFIMTLWTVVLLWVVVGATEATNCASEVYFIRFSNFNGLSVCPGNQPSIFGFVFANKASAQHQQQQREYAFCSQSSCCPVQLNNEISLFVGCHGLNVKNRTLIGKILMIFSILNRGNERKTIQEKLNDINAIFFYNFAFLSLWYWIAFGSDGSDSRLMGIQWFWLSRGRVLFKQQNILFIALLTTPEQERNC